MGQQEAKQDTHEDEERVEIYTDVFVGMVTEPLTQQESEALSSFNRSYRGIKVRQVVEDSPADQAGMCEGDVLLYLNGMRLSDPTDFLLCLIDLKPDDTAFINYLRDGKQKQAKVKLAKREKPAHVGFFIVERPHIVTSRETTLMYQGIAYLLSKPHLSFEELRTRMDELYLCLGLPENGKIQFSSSGVEIEVKRAEDSIHIRRTLAKNTQLYILSKEGDELPAVIRKEFKAASE